MLLIFSMSCSESKNIMHVSCSIKEIVSHHDFTQNQQGLKTQSQKSQLTSDHNTATVPTFLLRIHHRAILALVQQTDLSSYLSIVVNQQYIGSVSTYYIFLKDFSYSLCHCSGPRHRGKKLSANKKVSSQL